MVLTWCAQPESWVRMSAGTGASARASTARKPVPEITLPCPLTCDVHPRAVMPNTVAPMIRLLSVSIGPELRISIPTRASTSVLPDTMVCGAAGPSSSATRGPQRTSAPVTIVFPAPSRMAMPVILAQTSSPFSTVPMPPSSSMPVSPLPSAALFST